MKIWTHLVLIFTLAMVIGCGGKQEKELTPEQKKESSGKRAGT